jgi:4-amino-4-deoxychorismate lyase
MTALLFSSIEPQTADVSVNDCVATLSLANRGLCYGDGLFETIRVSNGEMPLLAFHRERYSLGIQRLKLSEIRHALAVFDQSIELCQSKLLELDRSDALIKLIFTRREGGRGYVPAISDIEPLIQIFEPPSFPPNNYVNGVDVILCEHRLSEQPILAGIKHLNRLDQVLAASELQGAAEGLVRDQSGLVVEGTKSNLLVFTDEGIFTPRIKGAGVAGVLRALLLSSGLSGIELKEADFSVLETKNAKGLALINGVFGCWPIKKFENELYQVDARCREIQLGLASALGFYNPAVGKSAS